MEAKEGDQLGGRLEMNLRYWGQRGEGWVARRLKEIGGGEGDGGGGGVPDLLVGSL